MNNDIAIICRSTKRGKEFASLLQPYETGNIFLFSSITDMDNNRNQLFKSIYIDQKPSRLAYKVKLVRALIPRASTYLSFDEFKREIALLKDWNDVYDTIYSSVLS